LCKHALCLSNGKGCVNRENNGLKQMAFAHGRIDASGNKFDRLRASVCMTSRCRPSQLPDHVAIY
jgi:hypothetical protein